MTMTSIRPAIGDVAVRAVVDDWFAVLGGSAPVERILGFFVRDGLVVRLPEAVLRSHDDVCRWWEGRLRRPPTHREVPRDVAVRITSPLHADVTMSVTRHETAAAEPAWTAGLSWSLVARDGVPRIRTYTVHPSPGADR